MRSFVPRHAAVVLLVVFAVALAASLGVALARAEEPADQPSQAPTVVGELMQKRTSTSKTWLLSNGMYRNEIFLGPIHFKNESGQWQDINTTLAADGVYSEYKSAATPVVVTIRDESPGNRPVRLELGGYVVEINMANSLEDTKIVQGNSARFFGVAHDADLKYEVLDDGVKETILLYSADAPTSYTFSLSHPGLTLAKDTEGNWGLYEPMHQRPLLVLSDVFAFDASQNVAGDPAVCNDAQMTVVPGDGKSRISFSLPASWLSDPQRVFPVSIDPTFTQSTWGDTYVSNLDPNTSHSSYNELRCGRVDTSTGKNRALVKFRITPAEGGALPSGAYIHEATFKAYQSYLQSGATARRTYVARMTSAWTEGSTWNSATPMTWDWIANQTLAQGDWLSVSCPTVVQRWLDGTYTNIGFVIYQQEDGSEDGAWYRKFRSAEYSNSSYRPSLVIDYETPSIGVSTDSSVYAIGDTVTVTSKVSSYYPGDVRVIENGLNRAAGTSATYRGVMGWFQTPGDVPAADPGQPAWQVSSVQPNGSVFAYDPSATYGGDKIAMVFSGCSQSTCGGTPGYKRATFQFTVGSSFGSLLDITPDTYFAMGPGSSNTWTQSWKTQSSSALNVLATGVDTATYITQASDWWNATSGPCDDNDHGRGALTLMWPKVTDAAGYHVYLADGSASSGNPVYRQVGATIGNGSTLWSSAGTGLYPSDTAVAGASWPGGVGGNPFYRATTPSDATQQQLLQPSGLTGAGLLVSDGSMLYTRRWMANAGPSTWTKVTLAGATNGTVGPSLASKDARSAFLLNGILYNGYVTTLVGNNATIEGVRISDGSTQSLTLAAPPLRQDRGSPITTGTNNEILLTSDGTSSATDSRIFSVAYTLTTNGDSTPRYDGYKIREYTTGGSYLGEHSIAMTSYTSEPIRGVVCDRNFIYLLQLTGTTSAHVTKISTQSWKITNQWSITQGSQGVVSGCFDAANNAIWLGAINQGKIYKYSGGWKAANDPTILDLRDNPNALYVKNGGSGGPRATWTAYDVKVVPVDASGAEMTAPANGKVAATLDCRTYSQNDDPQHSSSDLGSWNGHTARVQLDTQSLRMDTTDLAIASWGPQVALRCSYNSGVTTATSFAPGWRFGFEQNLAIGANDVYYTDAAGDVHHFMLVGGSWRAPGGYLANLTLQNGSLWIVRFPDQSVVTFDTTGRLVGEGDRVGSTVSYTYTSGKLSAITAANGQQITLTWNGAKLASASYATGAGTRQVTYATAAPWQVTYSYSSGNPSARTVTYGYDANSRLTAIDQLDWPANGQNAGQQFMYDAAGRLTEVRFADYHATNKPDARATLAYDLTACKAIVTRYGRINDTPNTSVASETDTWNPRTKLLETQELAQNGNENTTTSFEYDVNGQLSHTVCMATDSANETTQTVSASDTSGNVVATDDDSAGMATFTYNVTNDPLTESDAAGVASNTYDAAGNVTASQQTLNAAGDIARTEYSYDAQGRTTQERLLISGRPDASPVWAVTDYSNFAANGLPQTTVNRSVKLSEAGNPQDLTITTSYDAFGNLLTATDPSGTRVIEVNTYDTAGQLVTKSDAMGAVTHHTYDRLGNDTESWISHPSKELKENWKRFVFDARGRILTQSTLLSDSAGNPSTQSVVSTTWDGLGNSITSDDSTVGGEPAKSVFDRRGNVVKQWSEGAADQSDARATQSTYSADDRKLTSVMPNNTNPTSYDYDAHGNLVKQTEPDGSWVAYTYDEAGNKTSETRPKSGYGADPSNPSKVATTQFEYDSGGRMITETKPSGLATTFTYDALGRQVAASGGTGPASTTTYNTLGWVLKKTDADGVVVNMVYDVAGRPTSETKAGQPPTIYGYDGCGRLLTQTDPDGKLLTLTYDCFGNTVEEKHTVAGAVVKEVTTTSDSLGRPTNESDTVSGTTHTWTYPLNTAAGITETVRCASSPSATTTISRSARGTESQRSSDIGTGTNLVRSVDTRDAAERVTRATLAGAAASNWSYDAAGRLVRQYGAGWATGAATTDAYTYDPDTGQKATVNQQHADNLQLAYGGTITGDYTYDSNRRLATASVNGASEVYSFDPSGNLTQIVAGTTTSALTYDSADRLTQLTKTGGQNSTTIYQWNTTYGWRTSQGPTSQNQPVTYGYTATGRLASYGDTTRNLTATYSYDAVGQRSKSVVVNAGQTTTTNYVYDGLALLQLSASRSDGATWKMSYLYDENGVPYAGVYRDPATSTAPVVFGMVTSDRGDVVELLDAAGSPFVAYRYDAWGNPTAVSSQTTALISTTILAQNIAARQVLRYAGYAYDTESGLYYCSARSYDPATRQWISKDPAKADGEESAYQYCGGDPVNAVDPSGESFWSVVTSAWNKVTSVIKKVTTKYRWVYKPYRVWRLYKEQRTYVKFVRRVVSTGRAEEMNKARQIFLARKARQPVALYEEVFLEPPGDLGRLDNVSSSEMYGWAKAYAHGNGFAVWHANHNRVVYQRVVGRSYVWVWKSTIIYLSLWLPC